MPSSHDKAIQENSLICRWRDCSCTWQ